MKFLFLIFVLSFNAFAALPTEVQALWEKRAEPEKLKECLVKFEELHQKSPQDRELLVYLSRAYFLHGEVSFDEKEKMRAYTQSKDYGLKALSLNPEFQKQYESDLVKAAGNLKAEDMPAAFWTAVAIARWSGLNGVFSSLKYKNPMLALVTKVEELRPDYFYGAVYRFWGGFYAEAPGIIGGDLKKSKEYFEKVLQLYPEYVGTKVAMAEQYYVARKDEKKFRKLLEEVVATPLNGPQDIAPENYLEQKKAELLLEKRKKLF